MPTYRCLLVEDSKMMRELLSLALRRIEGLEITEAEHGLAGVRALAAGTFDLVVTDINMPVLDGLKLVKHIREDPRHAEVPIVIITTEGTLVDRERAIALGANAYIQKPVQAPVVLKTVRKLLKIG